MKRTEAVIVKCVRKLLMFIVAGSIACIPFLSSHAVESGDTVDSSNYSGYIMDTYERLGADRQDNTLGVPSFYDPRNLSYTTPNKSKVNPIFVGYTRQLVWLKHLCQKLWN